MEATHNADEPQRETCAKATVLLHTCEVCQEAFTKRQTNQVTCGKPKCRFSRHPYKVRSAQHKANDDLRMDRRRSKSLMDWRVREGGPQTHDNYSDRPIYVKDNLQRFSRCAYCSTVFVSNDGRLTPSRFAYCGESLLQTGECKKAWLAACVAPAKAPVKFHKVTEDDKRTGKRFKAPTPIHMPKSLTYFCPTCVEVVMKNDKEVRRTRGMYRPKEHDCGEVIA